MKVKEVMSTHPDVLSDEMTIKQAATEMQKHDFGFLPIMHDGEIKGVVTDRDLVIRGLANGNDPAKVKLKDIMSKHIYYCKEDDDITKVADLMCQKQVHRVAVYGKNNKITGIVSIGDIARKCKDKELCGRLTQAIHQG